MSRLRDRIRRWLLEEPEVRDIPLTEREKNILALFTEQTKVMASLVAACERTNDDLKELKVNFNKRQDVLIKLLGEYADKYLELTKRQP